MKELNCIYGISRLVEKWDIPLDDILQEVVDLIPSAWQYPEITGARIVLGGKDFCTTNFKVTPWMQRAQINVYSEQLGSLEVCLLERKPESGEGSFSKEKRNLIDEIAERLGDTIERKRAEEKLEKSQEQLRELTHYLQAVREEERTRISREIHDEFGQALTALKMDLAWTVKRLPKGAAALRGKTASMLETIDELSQLTQRMATELRPGMLDDLGLVAALEWQANEFQERTGIPGELHLPEDDLDLDRDLATALFRIFQETLTNIARHSGATQFSTSLEAQSDQLTHTVPHSVTHSVTHTVTLTVSDNGCGITEEQIINPRSLGLIGMRERVRHWGGNISINGKPGQGTTVIVNIPHVILRESSYD